MKMRPRIGAMAVLAACFFFSAAARLADPATASALDSDLAANENTEAVSTDYTGQETRLLKELLEREHRLAEQEKTISERTQTLNTAEASIREKLSEMQALEERLTAIVEIAESAAEEDVLRLVAAYQVMDGKRAAAIFDTMDVKFAAGLIARMRDEPAAAILSALTPEKAYAITAHIAGRNAGSHGN